ncbi:IucC family-domain-containing protein [Lentinula aciculospora]|uniref:IucC family-domain-containing protein n=1 Tax=Lentinula aciculospora TaxID=153920 RepID=A0A9W9A776_9AGAR|nr:IucC family-domain-containing protein [Lentinula aciculospora]
MFTTPQDPSAKANFATTSRLLSCLVTESLSRALYLPLIGFEATGFCVLLSGKVSSQQPQPIDVPYKLSDILAIVLLQHIPVFKYDGADPRGQEIGLLDPMDMVPLVLEIVEGIPDPNSAHFELGQSLLTLLSGPGWQFPNAGSTTILPSPDPLVLWVKFAKSYDVQEEMIKEIAEEFESSVRWQKYSYEHPPKAPLFSSSSVEWEQSIVEGHPTHPMHKTRAFLSPMQDISPGSYDLYNPKLRFVALPKSNLDVTYEFEQLTEPLHRAAAEVVGKVLVIPAEHLVIPVHELQVAHIEDKFKEAIIYPIEYSLPLLAQQSIRSVVVPNVYQTLSLKLGVGIKLTSAVRTISPASAYLGPRFSAQVVPALTMDHNILTVAKELASVVSAHPENDIAKHCAAIVREAHELDSESRGERLIVCTALVESGHDSCKNEEDGHLPAVIRVFELDTEEKRLKWLDEFVSIFCKAFLPSVLHNGVAFEAHPQNCVARFSLSTKQILGFIIRDFGGIRVHPPTLLRTTGVELDAVSGHSIIAPDLDDVYARMYHTVIHNHLQQLIRVLGLHYNGKGWEIVRRNLKENIPKDHGLYDAWLSPERKTFFGKCFMRMRMQGMYRFHLHGPFPNLIHYRGVAEDN